MKARNIEEARDLYEQECEDHLLWLIMSGDCIQVRTVDSPLPRKITIYNFLENLDAHDFVPLLIAKESEREEILDNLRGRIETEVRKWIQEDRYGILHDMIVDRLEEDNQKHREA